MTFGILTFHSQLNYGGVLQALALQHALEEFGATSVIDRWLSPDNRELTCGYPRFGRRGWVRFALRALLGLGEFGRWLRSWRTRRFIRWHFRLTPYNFCRWEELPAEKRRLLPQCLVVGSDQVWNCASWADPRPYLLEGIETKCALAYAASFGTTRIPLQFHDLYFNGLRRFNALSCREKQGCEICRSLGLTAEHVVDPTLLVNPDFWDRLIPQKQKACSKSRRIFCYLLGENLDRVMPVLEKIARERKCVIELFSDAPPKSWWIPLSLRPANISKWTRNFLRHWFSSVHLRVSAGPLEFLAMLSKADGVVSDSFHALMFSIVFRKNVRILRPSNFERREMFARIEEFLRYTQVDFTADGLENAFSEILCGAQVEFAEREISSLREASKSWLETQIRSFDHES